MPALRDYSTGSVLPVTSSEHHLRRSRSVQCGPQVAHRVCTRLDPRPMMLMRPRATIRRQCRESGSRPLGLPHARADRRARPVLSVSGRGSALLRLSYRALVVGKWPLSRRHRFAGLAARRVRTQSSGACQDRQHRPHSCARHAGRDRMLFCRLSRADSTCADCATAAQPQSEVVIRLPYAAGRGGVPRRHRGGRRGSQHAGVDGGCRGQRAAHVVRERFEIHRGGGGASSVAGYMLLDVGLWNHATAPHR